VDRTALRRRQARREAAAILVAAGWDLDRVSLAFGIGVGATQELMPREWREAELAALWGRE
jgi:hypothetical protein